MKRYLVLVIAAISPHFLCSQPVSQPPYPFEKRSFNSGGETLLYRIMYPLNYSASTKYPVFMLLHGSGERGSDNEAQLFHGGSLFRNDTTRREFPAIVIFPQCPRDSAWSRFTSQRDTSSITGRRRNLAFQPTPTEPARLAKLLLDSLVANNIADPKRMYIGGLSLGGFGTFDMIERYPDFFAAAVPICGGGDTTVANRFAGKVSVWMFHGDADKSVDVRNSRAYYATLQRLHADVKYTEYPGVGHNSWDNAFNEKALLPWLLAKAVTHPLPPPRRGN